MRREGRNKQRRSDERIEERKVEHKGEMWKERKGDNIRGRGRDRDERRWQE